MNTIRTWRAAGPLLLLAVAGCALIGGDRRGDTARSLHAIFDAHWERRLRENPDYATYLGDNRYNDRWPDRSLPALQKSHAANLEAMARLEAINRSDLGPQDRINYDLFRRQLEENIEGFRFRTDLMPVSPINWSGFASAATLARLLRPESEKDVRDWITRLHGYGEVIDQHIALMRLGIAEGRVPPKVTMQRIPDQVAAQIVDDPTASPLYAPLRSVPEGLPAEALRAEAQAAIREVVVPAWKRFGDFFNQEYLPACRDSIAATDLPDGAAYYAFRVRQMTTTNLTPEQIHDIGRSEVQRIREAMLAIKEQVKFTGDLQAFFDHLRTDPQFFHPTGKALLAAYALLSKKADPAVFPLFGTLPRTPYGVTPIPAEQAPNATTAYYYPPSDDGTRAGYFYVNLHMPETRPKWEMEALTLHEAVPGHHFQIALQQELGAVPTFRRLSFFTAFVEGWGLYAESLGEEMGFYTDPYSKFGQLTYEMWRAIRLVVDTGLHAKGWSREQAIDFFVANAPKTRNDVEIEVDRYISWPGQALAYKIGELKIKELRARATEALGAHFDLRGFHDTVLGSGAVPLDVLEKQVDAWIAKVKAAKAGS